MEIREESFLIPPINTNNETVIIKTLKRIGMFFLGLFIFGILFLVISTVYDTKTTYLECVGEISYDDREAEPSVYLTLVVDEWRWFASWAKDHSGGMTVYGGYPGYYYFKETELFLRILNYENGDIQGYYSRFEDTVQLWDKNPGRYDGRCKKVIRPSFL
jgi:hypothetical protein